MAVFKVTFQSVIQVTRTYDVDDEEEARQMGNMDAEDGQVGHFHERHAVSGEVTECVEIQENNDG